MARPQPVGGLFNRYDIIWNPSFVNGELQYSCVPHSDEPAEKCWGSHIGAIDKDVTELRDLRDSLKYQENMTNSVSAVSHFNLRHYHWALEQRWWPTPSLRKRKLLPNRANSFKPSLSLQSYVIVNLSFDSPFHLFSTPGVVAYFVPSYCFTVVHVLNVTALSIKCESKENKF